jgi:hypothetical protein
MVKTEETSIPKIIEYARGAQRLPPESPRGSREMTVVTIPMIIGRNRVTQPATTA